MPYPSIDNLIGNTPLVRLQRTPVPNKNTILLKLEGNNPAGSIKDRPALNMILQAERRGEISPGDRLIEATSGNTGIALAMVAAAKGYRMTLIMPDNLSEERKASMLAYGAELILVSSAQGMEGARDLALKMETQGQGRVLDQFSNADNPSVFPSVGPNVLARGIMAEKIEDPCLMTFLIWVFEIFNSTPFLKLLAFSILFTCVLVSINSSSPLNFPFPNRNVNAVFLA